MGSDDIGFEIGGGEGIDLSDAALEARGWESDGAVDPAEVPAEDDVVVSEPSEDVEAAEASIEGAGEASEDVADEASEEVEAEGESEAFEIPDKLKGKSAEELAKMFADLESHTAGRQANEIGDLRSIVEQQNAQLELLREHLASQASAQTADDLPDLVRANPTGIYQQALSALDNGHVNIDTVEQVIEEVFAVADELAEDGDTEAARHYTRLARSMERDFDRRMTLAQAQATQEPLQKQAKQLAYEKGVAAFFNQPDADEKADAFTYKQDVTNLLKGKDLGSTPEQVASTLREALIYVRGQNPTRSAAFQKQQAALKGSAQAERGNTDPPPKTLTEEERIRNQVFSSKDPAKDIFATFAL